MDFSNLKEGMKIRYISKSPVFDGDYTLVTAESTYLDRDKCPEHERGKLMIVEFMNDDTPMFFPIDTLNQNDWELAS